MLQISGGATLPTPYGSFHIWIATSATTSLSHPVLTMGDIKATDNVLLRIHSECFTGDVLGSLKCDCGDQLHESLKLIAERGSGALIYLRQEGRGIGLKSKIEAYLLQQEGLDTYDANVSLGYLPDCRDYDDAIAVCKALGIVSVDLITNNPDKISAITASDIRLNSLIHLQPAINHHNEKYIETKINKFGHRYQQYK